MFKNYLVVLRPHQWFKQSIVVLPLLSLGRSISLYDLALGLSAAITFTFMTSFVYIVNDYYDLEEDQLDSVRKKRPLAAGIVTKPQLTMLMPLLLILCFMCNSLLSQNIMPTTLLLVVYAAINLAYSKFNFKKQRLLGLSMVAIGFPIRFMFGCLFFEVIVSYWALVLLMELALFMLSVKRYQRTLRKAFGINKTNNTDPEFWMLAAIIFAAFFSASYAGFMSAPSTQAVWGSTALLLSAIPIALAIVRFLEIATRVENWKSRDVTDSLIKDIPLVFLAILYAVIMLVGSTTSAW